MGRQAPLQPLLKRRNFVLYTSALSFQVLTPAALGALEKDAMQPSTALVTDNIFLKHHISSNHPESPQRLAYFNRFLPHSPLNQILLVEKPPGNHEQWLEVVHTNDHIESIRTSAPVAHLVAAHAVSAALHAVDMVAESRGVRVFCATRPPGHHALNTGREEGFCYYNQVAIAARYAQQQHNFRKVLIVDWDYHHGNSTEAIFYNDPDVLFFSTHDQFAYPGTGDPEKRGTGEGSGLNVNIHLPCGTTDSEILSIYREKLVPLANQFEPDIVLLSAGFDSRVNDLLGCFEVTDQGFKQLTEIVAGIADKHCQGRLVSVLEGGYNLEGNARAMLAHLGALATGEKQLPVKE